VAAVLSAQTAYSIYYDPFVSTSVIVKVVSTADTAAILYSSTGIPLTFNYLTLNNVIKVISNFTAATAITGTGIYNGSACLTTCYLTYLSMTNPMSLATTTPPNSYSIHIEGLLTIVVLNPLFTL
jgi:hypothetical protein